MHVSLCYVTYHIWIANNKKLLKNVNESPRAVVLRGLHHALEFMLVKSLEGLTGLRNI